jgi:hypothetical protein
VTTETNGGTVTYLDSTRKTYWTANIPAVLRKALKFNSRKPVASAAHFSVDSLGDGGVVAGFHTVHFQGHTTSAIRMSLLGDTTTWFDTTTTDYYVAPGLRIDTLGVTGASAPKPAQSDMSGSKKAEFDTELKEFAGVSNNDAMKARAMITRMDKLGYRVTTVAESRVTMKGGVKQTRTTTELLDHSTMIVPDSLFIVPRNYTRTMPGFMPVR